MVDRIAMDKGSFLGYGNLDDLELVGRAFGYDIYVDETHSHEISILVYDRNVTNEVRRGIGNKMETRYRVVSKILLTKERMGMALLACYR